MTEPELTAEQIAALVDGLVVECGIPVDGEDARPSAEFKSGGSAAAREFVNRDAPVAVPVLAPAQQRFVDALQHAATNGKVKGQVTKLEAQNALKLVAMLPVDEQRALVASVIASEVGKALSRGAREALESLSTARADED